MLLADARLKRIVRYSGIGRWLGTGREAIDRELEAFSPYGIRAHEAGFLVEFADGKLMAFDNSLIPRERVNTRGMTAEVGQGSLESLILWEPVGRDIVAFGDLRDGEEWSSGLVRFSRGRSPKLRILRKFSLFDPLRTVYRLGYPYIAALGDFGYVLLMEERVSLYASHRDRNELTPLTVDLPGPELRPVLPSLTRTDAAATMRAVEQSAIYAGIYGWEGHLYLLSREPDGSGTRWMLMKIDPKNGVVGSAILPTRANHLTVIPGPMFWALLEKGPVRGWGVQEVSSVWMVDSGKVRSFRGRIGKLCNNH